MGRLQNDGFQLAIRASRQAEFDWLFRLIDAEVAIASDEVAQAKRWRLRRVMTFSDANRTRLRSAPICEEFSNLIQSAFGQAYADTIHRINVWEAL